MPIERAAASSLLTGAFLAAGLPSGILLGGDQVKGVASALDRVENLTLDWRFLLAGARPAPRGVVIVAIDDETLRQAGGDPLPRRSLARIVRRIADFHPRALALDIALLDQKDAATDAELPDAPQTTTSVVAAIWLFGENRPS